jgi:hypothetical protein
MDMPVYNKLNQTYNRLDQMDSTLSQYFSWAGSSFPYCGDTDVTINSNTVWGGDFQTIKVSVLISNTSNGTAGTAIASVTSAHWSGDVTVNITAAAVANTVAGQLVTALNITSGFSTYFNARLSTCVSSVKETEIYITTNSYYEEDTTFSITIKNGTCTGISTATSIELFKGSNTYLDGYVKSKKLTLAAGTTLSIVRNPFFIFADEINFGSTSSIIDASGRSGSSELLPPPIHMAAGGIIGSTQNGTAIQGGCGGGIIIIICNKITGAQGCIKANGGNGYEIGGGGSSSGIPGQGALLGSIIPSNSPWGILTPGARLLGLGGMSGGTSACQGIYGSGGFYGAYNNYSAGGGSGIGGGSGDSGAGHQHTGLTVKDILYLASIGCTGGGGGGVSIYSQNSGGGGGGAVVIVTHSYELLPQLIANGGTNMHDGNIDLTPGNGGAAGFTSIELV